MPLTSEVAKKNAARLLAKDPDHFRKMGKRSKAPGPFASVPGLASRAGKISAERRKQQKLQGGMDYEDISSAPTAKT